MMETISLTAIFFISNNSPSPPIKSVTSNWLMLQTMVSEIAFKRLPSSIYKILPKYSPTRFGVVMENETPENIAFKDLLKLTG